jgi:hypothetical protein
MISLTYARAYSVNDPIMGTGEDALDGSVALSLDRIFHLVKLHLNSLELVLKFDVVKNDLVDVLHGFKTNVTRRDCASLLAFKFRCWVCFLCPRDEIEHRRLALTKVLRVAHAGRVRRKLALLSRSQAFEDERHQRLHIGADNCKRVIGGDNTEARVKLKVCEDCVSEIADLLCEVREFELPLWASDVLDYEAICDV